MQKKLSCVLEQAAMITPSPEYSYSSGDRGPVLTLSTEIHLISQLSVATFTKE